MLFLGLLYQHFLSALPYAPVELIVVLNYVNIILTLFCIFLQSDGDDSPPDDSDADSWWCAEGGDKENEDFLSGEYALRPN